MTMTSAPYGYCTVCAAPGEERERRQNGNDRCGNGHTYPSADARSTPHRPDTRGVAEERAAVVAMLREEERLHEAHGSRLVASSLRHLGDIIERGEHCREEER